MEVPPTSSSPKTSYSLISTKDRNCRCQIRTEMAHFFTKRKLWDSPTESLSGWNWEKAPPFTVRNGIPKVFNCPRALTCPTSATPPVGEALLQRLLFWICPLCLCLCWTPSSGLLFMDCSFLGC